MERNKKNLNAVFLDRHFKYEYDNEKRKLILLINKEDIELFEFLKLNFKKISSIKNALVVLEDNSLIWYVKECEYCLTNEIIFKIDYVIELYSSDAKINTIELKSMGLDLLLHPANYFYFNKECSKNDVLYNIIKMKTFDFNYEKDKISVCVYIGNLLSRGICSNLINNITLSLNFEYTTDIIKICNIIDYVRNALKVLSYSDNFQFDNIELKNLDNNYVGKISENKIINSYKSLATSNTLYFSDIMEKIFNNIHKLDISKLSFIKLECNKKDYCTILINLFSMFESNFKMKFKEYKSPTIDEEQSIVVKDCIIYLDEYIKTHNNNKQFIQSLKNRIETYNNSLFNKLNYALIYYCKKLIDEERFPRISLRLKWLYFKELYSDNNVDINNISNAAQRLYSLRNIIVHDEEMPTIEKMDEFWINAFDIIIYTMMLDNLGLDTNEILEHTDIFY